MNKFKKIRQALVLLSCLSVLFCTALSAQNWKFGVSLNPQITSVHWGENNNYLGPGYDFGQFPLLGFRGGLEISRRINDRFSFLSGMQIAWLRYGNHNLLFPPDLFPTLTNKGGLMVLSLPAVFRFETKKGFYFALGAQISPSVFTAGHSTIDPDGTLYSRYAHFYNRFILNPGSHVEAGYRFQLNGKSIYTGAAFDMIFKKDGFIIWSAGIKASLFFGKD